MVFIGDSGSVTSLIIPYVSRRRSTLTQPVLLSSKFNLPLLSANNIALSFLPDPLERETLPSPGRGASLEAKLIVGDGSAHAVWKIIEGERSRWEEHRRRGEEEELRKLTQGLS